MNKGCEDGLISFLRSATSLFYHLSSVLLVTFFIEGFDPRLNSSSEDYEDLRTSLSTLKDSKSDWSRFFISPLFCWSFCFETMGNSLEKSAFLSIKRYIAHSRSHYFANSLLLTTRFGPERCELPGSFTGFLSLCNRGDSKSRSSLAKRSD